MPRPLTQTPWVTLGSGYKQKGLGSSHGSPQLRWMEGVSPPPPPHTPPRTPEALLPASVPLSSPWSSPSTPDIRACTSNPCANNGTCANLDNGQYECSCPPGFSGRDCQTEDLRRGNIEGVGEEKKLGEKWKSGNLRLILFKQDDETILETLLMLTSALSFSK